MKERALKIVVDYVSSKYGRNEAVPHFEVFLVWMCKTLENWKFLISTTMNDGMYYEITYNGHEHEWYLDAYVKVENQVIKDE